MSKIKTKAIPSVVNEKNVNDAFRRVYDDLNDLINSVNNEFGDYDKQRGTIGNLRVKKIDNNEYRLEAKTSDGWAAVNLTILEENL
jgi:hypothetical protein